MTFLGALAAPLLRCYCAPRAAVFARALDDVAAAQRRALARIVHACAATDYGRSLGLASGDGVDEFRARVPLVDYPVVEPWILRQRDECRAVITPGRTRCYEPTSGSSGPAKHVPYNDALLGSFRSLFAIWAHDLLVHTLHLRSGRTFISISSPLRGQEGFNDEREYLGSAMRMFVDRFLVTAPTTKQLRDPERFRDALACTLAACSDLEIISVWNPSYLLILLEHFELSRERLLPALPRGRRAVLERDPLRWHEVWPSLQLLSCWSEGAAAAPAARLASMFTGATLQGKGLLATEAPVTVPLAAAGGCVPLVDEVFLELEDKGGDVCLLHEAEEAAEYALVITQAAGLLRYRLGDRVKISGRHRGVPLLRFRGRADAVSDLVGEKLNETFVAQALREVAAAQAFCTLLPVLPESGRPHYWLLTDDPRPVLGQAMEEALMRAFRYREARFLDQLGALQILVRSDMRRAVHDALAASGLRAGDIKDRALLPSLELASSVRARLMGDQRATA